MKTLLFALVVGAGIGASASAHALGTGQCLPAAQVRAMLAAEGQNPIIVGNRAGYGYPTALILTSNADGSKGYMLRGDKPFGEQADTICIDSVFADVRLNDFSEPGVPAWALMNVDSSAVDEECKLNRLGYQETCTVNDVVLKVLNGNGQTVLFAATGTAINPRDKTVRARQHIVVTFTAKKDGGLVMAVTPTGANYMLSGYSPINLTQHGEALMARR